MNNFKKRKYISRDVSFHKNHKPQKKLKVNGLTYERQSPINWHEVKIVLDARVVEKYLNKKKSYNEIFTTPITNELPSSHKQNLIPYLPKTSKKISKVFSENNNAMVKLEIPEDVSFDDSAPDASVASVYMSIKQEGHIAVQDTDALGNGRINDSDFAKSTYDEFKCQNVKNHSPLAAQVVEEVYKNDLPESKSFHEEVTIGQEFKHEEVIFNYENDQLKLVNQKNVNTSLINQENSIVSKDTPVKMITRSNRKRKTCQDCDNCDHEVVKKSRIPSHDNKKRKVLPVKDSNRSSESRTSPKINRPKPFASLSRSSRKRKTCQNCDNCDDEIVKKSRIPSHDNKKCKVLPVKDSNRSSESRTSPKINRRKPLASLSRSSRKRKTCQNCDNCDQEVVKRSQIPSHDNKKRKVLPVKNSNRNVESTISLKINRRKPVASPQPQKNVLRIFECDACIYKVPKKSFLIRHIMRAHKSLFPHNRVPCPKCKKYLHTMTGLRKHKGFCPLQFFLKCTFCFVSFESEQAMKVHLETRHINKFHGKSYQEIADEVHVNSMKHFITTLERKGLRSNPAHTGEKFVKVRKYCRELISKFITLYCTKCHATYKKLFGKTMKYCRSCNTQLLFQCQKCNKTRPNYDSIWKHLLSKDSDCDMSENLLSVINEEEPDINNQAASPDGYGQKYYNCETCDYKGLTKPKLYKHILLKHMKNSNVNKNLDEKKNCYTCLKCGVEYPPGVGMYRFRRHKELCGISSNLPCRFCPMTFMFTKQLISHMNFVHVDELDGIYTKDIVEEVLTFRKMMKEINTAKFNERIAKTAVTGETITNSDDYLCGIESLLKPICLKCNATSSLIGMHQQCTECQTILNFQCTKCDIHFSKYSAGWEHVTQTCKNRIFTLIVNKTGKDPLEDEISVAKDEPLFHCDYCDFKHQNKSVISRHVGCMHNEETRADRRFICFKCDEYFNSRGNLNYHKRKCRMKFIYTCYFCSYFTGSTIRMKKHIISSHAAFFHSEGGVTDEALNEIIQKIMNNKLDKDEGRIYIEANKSRRGKFSEYVKFIKFYCPKCNENFGETIRNIKNIKLCPKCHCELTLECKNCGSTYGAWDSIVRHIKNESTCINRRKNKFPSYVLDHSYAVKNPLETAI